jgi:hypothetical protein
LCVSRHFDYKMKDCMEHAPPIETAVYSAIRSRPGTKTEQWNESEEIVEVPDDDDGAGHGHFQNNFLKKRRWGSQFDETPT